MKLAIALAEEAFSAGEVPVGAVVTDGNGEIISSGRNRCESGGNAILHAEISAISDACKKNGNWRLENCSLYVTLEPCPMCAGAIVNARISNLIFGAPDRIFGAAGSAVNVFGIQNIFKVNVIGGILAVESSALLKNFFKKVRKR